MNAGDKNIGFRMATIVFCAIGLIFVCMLSYKNYIRGDEAIITRRNVIILIISSFQLRY